MVKLRGWTACVRWAAGCALAVVSVSVMAETPPAPVDVMIVGTFHMANPGRDIYNLKVDDMLAPKRQAEIEAVTKTLARFRPNRVAVEWSADDVERQYPRYLDGTLAPTASERVQLGFRLGRLVGAKGVYGVDVDGDFPYPELKAYAEAHGQAGLLTEAGKKIMRTLDEEQAALKEHGVAGILRLLNDPARIAADQGHYRDYLRIGGKDGQPGVDVLTGWYRRNLTICANLIQLAKPGDRIVVIYGAGHAFLLRQCVTETPGFRLVEANDYLPRT